MWGICWVTMMMMMMMMTIIMTITVKIMMMTNITMMTMTIMIMLLYPAVLTNGHCTAFKFSLEHPGTDDDDDLQHLHLFINVSA